MTAAQGASPRRTGNKRRRTNDTFMSLIERVFKPRYLGLGFVWAWVYCAFNTSALYPERSGISINADPSWLISAVTVSIAFIITGICMRKLDLSRQRWMSIAAPLLTAVGSLLSGLGAHAFLSNVGPLEIITGIMTGVGSAWLCLLWGDEFTHLDIEHIEFAVPSASAITLICTLVFPSIQGVPGIIGVASLPIISGLLLAYSYKGTAKSPHVVTHDPQASTIKLLVRLGTLIAVSYIAIGFLSATAAPRDIVQTLAGIDVATFLGSSCGIVLAVLFVTYSIKVDFPSFYRWIIPVIILDLALSPWNAVLPNLISSTLISVLDIALQTIIFIYFISASQRKGISAVLGIGIGKGASQIGVLIGNIVGVSVVQQAAGDPQILWIALFVIICLVAFSTLILPPEGAYQVDHIEKEVTAPDKPTEDDTVTRLAHMHGLSARETEVFGYLARGRNQPYIRDHLVLSKNTVATHVKHIYQKLDVHSRQELLDLVDRSHK
ncbi:MAG: helix-turn-helix transcriptional regulator [Eggerthellaceae bacterium]|nr:helix-turn-helix transcriptional regulator [Eggerthellaceae bacterium]MCH4221511.1 helix-turn-helix transcriptional regulator [Eggerthellaceae bacterium]